MLSQGQKGWGAMVPGPKGFMGLLGVVGLMAAGCGGANALQCPGGIEPGSQGSLSFLAERHFSESPPRDEILAGRSVELPCVGVGDDAVHGPDSRQPGEQLVEFYSVPNKSGVSGTNARFTIRYPGKGSSGSRSLDQNNLDAAQISYNYFEDSAHQNLISAPAGAQCISSLGGSASLQLDVAAGTLEFINVELCGSAKNADGGIDNTRTEHLVLKEAHATIASALWGQL